mmetsp:Transcript_29290/g.38503  ORF Transcript_29290/g.38503 Transcript_29290/m.38503 type:complete len:319 (+) Transcript_29290:67-1023(+)|eukprot:CAMPEP_0117743486 /NCGR_PEP_ID=MMETSP0947-20121206/6168_1 /TAXON_ID=44440 /ORGANISM="Chattonella subsalsa, Strain CCMP2191" /LENGTH=318 /DNA_ID=CAMNT_0005560205 /DNA_START=15 /DNA_END=971 /DNA_ORIENTATION=+
MVDEKCYCIAICIAVVIILVTISTLIGLSFAVLAPNYVGFDYNGVQINVDETNLYEEGRYFLGLGHSFIRFPTLQVSVTFGEASEDGDGSIYGRTKDGLQIILDVSFQYKLDASADTLWELYGNFLTDYNDDFKVFAAAAILDAASTYTAFDSINERESLAADMETAVSNALVAYGATVQTLQLENIELPSGFSSAIDATIEAEQEADQAQFEQISAGINAETTILEAELQAEITLVNANATAVSTKLAADAEAASITVQLEAERVSYGNLLQRLRSKYGDDFNPSHMLSYIWVNAIQEANLENLIVQIDKPSEVKFT